MPAYIHACDGLRLRQFVLDRPSRRSVFRPVMIVSRLLIAILILFILPLATHVVWWVFHEDLGPDWSRADWTSAKILPAPQDHPGALIRIYAARTGQWKGAFALHTWIVVKDAGALRYTRYDKVGWGSPVRTDAWPADARWFGHAPDLVLALEGEEAARLVPGIRKAVAEYPYRNGGDYRIWPGPNSNTFVAHVVAEVPGLQVAMPPNALGKDFHPLSDIVGPSPSRTGIRIQLGGLLGLTIGWVEGVELNFLGLVTGIDIRHPALKLPGWGRIGMPIGA